MLAINFISDNHLSVFPGSGKKGSKTSEYDQEMPQSKTMATNNSMIKTMATNDSMTKTMATNDSIRKTMATNDSVGTLTNTDTNLKEKIQFTLYLLVSSADNPRKQFGPRHFSVLIRIQNVRQEFSQILIVKRTANNKKACKIPQYAKSKSKATSSLFLGEMIAKLERTRRFVQRTVPEPTQDSKQKAFYIYSTVKHYLGGIFIWGNWRYKQKSPKMRP